MSRNERALAIINERRAYSGGLLSPPNAVRRSGPSCDDDGRVVCEPRPHVEPYPWNFRLPCREEEDPVAWAAYVAAETRRIDERNADRRAKFIAEHPDWVDPDAPVVPAVVVVVDERPARVGPDPFKRQAKFTFED